jgi:hypothetical protein
MLFIKYLCFVLDQDSVLSMDPNSLSVNLNPQYYKMVTSAQENGTGSYFTNLT